MTQPPETFDSAYTKLEATIRNFSREKLFYESQLSNQKNRIENLQSEINDLNQQLQAHQCEKREFQETWKQDEEHRCSIEAAIIETEKKIEVYFSTLRHFEDMMHNINYNIELFKEIVKTCKTRQLQLLDHIFMTDEKHKKEILISQDTINSLECKVQKYVKDLYASNIKCDEYQTKVDKMEHGIDDLNEQNGKLRQQVCESETRLEDKIKEHNALLDHTLLTDEKHKKEVLMSQDTINSLENKVQTYVIDLSASQQKCEEYQTKVDKMEHGIDYLETENGKLRQQVCESETRLEDKIKEHNALLDQLLLTEEKHKKEVLMSQDTINSLENEVQKYVIDLSASQQKCEEYQTKVEKMEHGIEDLETEICKLRKQVSEGEAGLSDKIKEYNELLDQTLLTDEKHKKEVLMGHDTINSLENKVQKYLIDLSASQQKCEEYQTKVEKMEHGIEDFETEICELRKKVSEDETRLEDKIKEYNVLLDQLLLMEEKHKKEVLMSQDTINSLENEVQKYVIDLSASQQKCEEYQTKVDKFEHGIGDLETEIWKLRQQVTEGEAGLADKIKEYNELLDQTLLTDEKHKKEVLMSEDTINSLESKVQKYLIDLSASQQKCEEYQTKLEKLEHGIEDLETEICKLRKKVSEDETRLEEKIEAHNMLLDQILLTDEKHKKEVLVSQDTINSLENKVQQYVIDLSASQQKCEEYQTKVDKFEHGIEDLETEISKLRQQVSEGEARLADKIKKYNEMETSLNNKEEMVYSLEQNISDLRKSVQEYRIRSNTLLNNLKEETTKRESLEDMYESKLDRLKKDLTETSKDLTDLRRLNDSRERAISKFMSETNPVIPITFDSQGTEKSTAAAFTVSAIQDAAITKQKQPVKEQNKIETAEKLKPNQFWRSPKSYAGPSTPKLSQNAVSSPFAKPSVISYRTAISASENKLQKKVSFKEPEKQVMNAKEYFGFDSSSGNSDLDSPKKKDNSKPSIEITQTKSKPSMEITQTKSKPSMEMTQTKSKLSLEMSQAKSKPSLQMTQTTSKPSFETTPSKPKPLKVQTLQTGKGKRIAMLEMESSELSPPCKKDKADVVVPETPKIPARKFFRNRKANKQAMQ